MSAAAPLLMNGIVPSPLQPVNEALEYEKILKLRDEVFAGSHPRLHVPAHALRTFSPRPPQPISQNSLAVPSVLPTSASPSQLDKQQPTHATASPALPLANAAIAHHQTAGTTSDFNPVLLTKSNDLLQAELKIKRQRLEKTLKEQFEQKRLEARRRPNPAEAKPDFDISAILAKVLDDLKPGPDKDDAEASDSFDENSFYSSRAPDSTPERGHQSLSDNEDEPDIDAEADALSGPRTQSAVMGAPLNAEQNNGHSPQYVPHELGNDTMDLDDDEEEGEYSPPEAVEDENGLQGGPSMHDSHDPRGRPLRRYSEVEDGKGPTSPGMRIVRNHIISPLAPQPSRVSPLTLAKDPPLEQNPRMRRRQNQGGSPEPIHPRKKRKMDRQERKARRNGGMSPRTFIKEERVTPPPFHPTKPLGDGRMPMPMPPPNPQEPITIDDGPQDVRYPPPVQYIQSPTRAVPRQLDPQMPLSEPRGLSRQAMRPMRDDQDLRRVASLHSMRAEQPREYADVSYETPPRRVASYREASPMVNRQPIDDNGGYYERQSLQEVRRTPAPQYREIYQDQTQVQYEPLPPPPPPSNGRIVIDEYGRRFREIVQQPTERVPMVPSRAMSVRPQESQPQYESNRGSRAGSVFVDTPPIERRYAQEMMPPPIYRQADQAPRASAMPMGPPRDQYEQPGMMRSSSVQIIDHPRQTVYIDERDSFRAPVRMASVRPINSQYEELPREAIARASSVRPNVRDPTGYEDDRAPVRYLPVEQQPRYRVVEQPEGRYYDAEGRELVPQRPVQYR